MRPRSCRHMGYRKAVKCVHLPADARTIPLPATAPCMNSQLPSSSQPTRSCTTRCNAGRGSPRSSPAQSASPPAAPHPAPRRSWSPAPSASLSRGSAPAPRARSGPPWPRSVPVSLSPSHQAPMGVERACSCRSCVAAAAVGIRARRWCSGGARRGTTVRAGIHGCRGASWEGDRGWMPPTRPSETPCCRGWHAWRLRSWACSCRQCCWLPWRRSACAWGGRGPARGISRGAWRLRSSRRSRCGLLCRWCGRAWGCLDGGHRGRGCSLPWTWPPGSGCNLCDARARTRRTWIWARGRGRGPCRWCCPWRTRILRPFASRWGCRNRAPSVAWFDARCWGECGVSHGNPWSDCAEYHYWGPSLEDRTA